MYGHAPHMYIYAYICTVICIYECTVCTCMCIPHTCTRDMHVVWEEERCHRKGADLWVRASTLHLLTKHWGSTHSSRKSLAPTIPSSSPLKAFRLPSSFLFLIGSPNTASVWNDALACCDVSLPWQQFKARGFDCPRHKEVSRNIAEERAGRFKEPVDGEFTMRLCLLGTTEATLIKSR